MFWENNIMGMVAAKAWLDVGGIVQRPNDPIDGLFGDDKTNNLVASWHSIASEYQIPMMAQFHGFDTESKTTFRAPIDTHNIEKGLIKVKMNQSERLRELRRSGVTLDEELRDFVFNDGIRLADQVVTRSKVAKNELMATGKVTIKENKLDLTVDYGVPEENTSYTLDLSAEADIPTQIQTIIDKAAEQGVVITGIMTSRRNITKMRGNKSIQTAVNGNIGAGAIVRNSAFEDFLNDEYGITTVITNDLVYGSDTTFVDGTNKIKPITKRYYPENKVTFFATNPGGKLGIGLWGNPPELEAAQFMDVAGSGVSPYVYVSQWAENDPAVLWTKASALFMPVLYNPNSLFIATVADTGA